MEALGLIETKGLIAAVESADAMLKAAEVTLLEKTYVGGGLVSVAVTGGVAAVKAAVEAGAAAVGQINKDLLVSQHVIPRPSSDIDGLIGNIKKEAAEELPVEEKQTPGNEESIKETTNTETLAKLTKEEKAEVIPSDSIKVAPKSEKRKKENPLLNLNLDEIKKEIVDQIVKEEGYKKAEGLLEKLKVTKLRNIAREYKKFRIAGREISKADKKKLLEEFKEYYKKN